MLLLLLLRCILTKCQNFFNDMDKFVVRLQGNKTRDPQSSNADYIAQNTFEKSWPRTEQQVSYSSRNEHELSSPRQKQILLEAKKEAIGEVILIERFKPNGRKLTRGFATILVKTKHFI